MNRFSRIMLFLISLLGMLTCAGSFFMIMPVGEISPFLRLWYEKAPYMNHYLAGFLVFIFILFLCVFIAAFAYPRKSSFILYKKPTGEIKISKSAVHNMILSSIADLVNTENIKLKVIYSKNTIKRIKITVYHRYLEKLPTLSEDMQKRAGEAAVKILEIPVGKIEVLISEKEQRRRKEKRVV